MDVKNILLCTFQKKIIWSNLHIPPFIDEGFWNLVDTKFEIIFICLCSVEDTTHGSIDLGITIFLIISHEIKLITHTLFISCKRLDLHP